jgi:hypothetical protein
MVQKSGESGVQVISTVENLEHSMKELAENYKNLEKAYLDLKVAHDMLKGELTRMVARDVIVGPSPDIGPGWGFGPLDFGIWANESLPWNQWPRKAEL